MSVVLCILAISDQGGEDAVLDRTETEEQHMDLGQQHCAATEVILGE